MSVSHKLGGWDRCRTIGLRAWLIRVVLQITDAVQVGQRVAARA